MPRTPDPSIKEAVLTACAKAAIDEGMQDLSLARLAKLTKVSRRMLIYHFSSVEGLLEETLGRVQLMMRHKFHLAIADATSQNTRQALKAFLSAAMSESMEAAMHTYFYLTIECMRKRGESGDFIIATVPGWIAWAKDELAGHSPAVSDRDLTLIFAVLRGLLLDYWATRDHKRIKEAMEVFVDNYQFNS